MKSYLDTYYNTFLFVTRSKHSCFLKNEEYINIFLAMNIFKKLNIYIKKLKKKVNIVYKDLLWYGNIV